MEEQIKAQSGEQDEGASGGGWKDPRGLRGGDNRLQCCRFGGKRKKRSAWPPWCVTRSIRRCPRASFLLTSVKTSAVDEVVKTGMESAAKLVFSDNTNLSMGPGSAVTLNKFVYSGAGSYEKATFQLVKGAFRFTTGGSDKRAYEIKTPTATIGSAAQSWISALTPLP